MGELTLYALAGRFVRVHDGAHCKPYTAAGYCSVLEGHILPALGEVGRAEGATWPPAVAAIRLLLLTGCRRGEILNLRSEFMDSVFPARQSFA